MALVYNSKSRREDVYKPLVKALELAAEAVPFDVMVVCAYRNKSMQDKAFKEGKSKLKWPNSAHNKAPAQAVDICPYVDKMLLWTDEAKFDAFRAELSKHTKLKPKIKWDMGHMEVECG